MGILIAVPMAIIAWEVISYIVLKWDPIVLIPIFLLGLFIVTTKLTINSLVK